MPERANFWGNFEEYCSANGIKVCLFHTIFDAL